jgi:hypothetical protein
MDCRQLLVLGMIALLTTSWATKKLWEATEPQEYVSVPQNEVSQAELRARGVDYRKDDEHGLYNVEKSTLRVTELAAINAPLRINSARP